MRLTRLSLRNFRCYAAADLALAPGLVAVVGPNGSGKTSLLEAAHLTVQGFSLRTRRDAAMVRAGCEEARVEAQGRRRGEVPFTATALLGRRAGKRLELDGAPIASVEQLRSELYALAFTPDRLAVVKGGPMVRRMYVDRMLGRLRPARASIPAEYAHALAQRNACLRRIRGGQSPGSALAPWDAALVRAGAALDAARAEAVEALAPRFRALAASLGLEDARIAYAPVPVSDALLVERRAQDIERAATGAGPHLADLVVEAQRRDLRAFGSQGEQRLAVLALLLAEAHLAAEERGEPPLLLLDDVLSELDDERRALLLAGVPGGSQVLVTATSVRAFPAHGPGLQQVVEVAAGAVAAR